MPLRKITKGQRVTFKPEWSDKGDDDRLFLAMGDEYDGRLLVVAIIGLPINPTQIVGTNMIETATDFLPPNFEDLGLDAEDLQNWAQEMEDKATRRTDARANKGATA